MKTKYFSSFVVLILAAIVSLILAEKVPAQELTGAENVQYPVAELGNCQDKASCLAYCDQKEHMAICLDFAERNNLMSAEELKRVRKFVEAGGEGPGGCRGQNECEAYCSHTAHIDECITFAIENDLMPPEELEEALRVQEAIRRGAIPPACGSKRQCDIYCEEPEHMEECIAFGIAAGFIQGQELEDVQKMLAALKKGVKPPPCRGKESCDQYCSSPENMEVCMNFAMEAGFMGEQEKADAQKMLQALKKGAKPPNCRGKEECDVYCAEESHFEECMNFAEAAGFMSVEDAAMARKTKGKGPGGCKGKEECEAFCNNPGNQETCFNFAKEHGLIPEEDLKRMEEGKQQFRQLLEQMPPEVADCLKSLVGEEMFERFKTGAAMPSREIGDQMRACFEKMGPPMGPGENQTGPGGCKGPEECEAYCDSHPEECQKFQPGPGVTNPAGQMMPPQAGPGGCKSPEECQSYCQSNPQDCQGFEPGMPPEGSPGMPGGPIMPSGPGQMPPQGQMQPGMTPPPQGWPGPGPGECASPEECQQMIQNQMPPLEGVCEGPNCYPDIAPPGQFEGQPSTGNETMPSPSSQNPSQYQEPPVNQMSPEGQTSPEGNIAPPPSEQPTSFLDFLLGVVLYPIKLLLR